MPHKDEIQSRREIQTEQGHTETAFSKRLTYKHCMHVGVSADAFGLVNVKYTFYFICLLTRS